MNLKSVELRNFKNLTSYEQSFNGGVYLVKADNEIGKSTLIGAIMTILTGERTENILQKGKEEGYAKGNVDNRYEVIVEFNKRNPRGTLKVKDLESGMTQEKGAKTLLNQIFNYSDFDAQEFVNWSNSAEGRRKQVEAVKSLLDEKTRNRINEIEQKVPAIKEERKTHKKSRDVYESQLQGFNLTEDDLGRTPINIEELKQKKEKIRKQLNEKYKENKAYNDQLKTEYDNKLQDLDNEINQHNSKLDSIGGEQQYLWETVNNMTDTTRELRENLKNAFGIDIHVINEENIQRVKDDLNHVERELPKPRSFEKESKSIKEPEYIEEMPDDSELKEIDQELEEAYENNSKVEEIAKYNRLKKQMDEIKANIEQKDKDIQELEKEKADLIQKSKLPIKGLSFSDDGLQLNGIPVKPDTISTSQAMELAVNIAMEKNKNVKIFKIAQGESLGKEKLKQIVKIANDKGFQGFIERRTDDDELRTEQYYEGTETDSSNQ